MLQTKLIISNSKYKKYINNIIIKIDKEINSIQPSINIKIRILKELINKNITEIKKLIGDDDINTFINNIKSEIENIINEKIIEIKNIIDKKITKLIQYIKKSDLITEINSDLIIDELHKKTTTKINSELELKINNLRIKIDEEINRIDAIKKSKEEEQTIFNRFDKIELTKDNQRKL